MERPERRHLSCIMFTDMVGFSALAQADERRALELLEEQRRLTRPILARRGGREIKTIGDGLLVEFASAVEAAGCAIDVQRALFSRNAEVPAERRLQIRIGLHVGDVVVRDDDVYGDGVNVASRIEACASPGGIALTDAVADQVANKLDVPVVRVGSRRLKNLREPIGLHRVVLPWDAEAVAAHRRSRRWWAGPAPRRAALLAAAVLLAGGLVWALTRGTPPPAGGASIHSLAVLPLENLSGDPGQDYFVDGMHDALIAELAQIGALRVISRTSTVQYRDSRKSIPEIGRELGADALVEGSVLRADDRVRITVQLIAAAADRHLWSRSYERELRNVLDLQGQVAREIAGEIRVKLTPHERVRLSRAQPIDPEAHEAVLRGRWYRDKGTPEDLQKAFESFQKALDEDPDYAAAHTGIATYYSILPFYSDRSPSEVLPRARAAVLRALELDETLPEAHAALAYLRAYYEWDWSAAERAFRRTLELNPSYADAHFSYSRFLAAQGRFAEARTEVQRAYELDPLSLPLKTNHALLAYFEGDYDAALAELDETLEIDPELSLARWGRALVLEQMRRYPEAIAELEEIARSPNSKASLGHLYAVAGERAKADAILAELAAAAEDAYVPSYFFALVHAGLGEQDEAFDWLERAYRERSSVLAYLRLDPRIANLRGDPRYDELVRRLRFPA